MIAIHDRADMAQGLALELDTQLRAILTDSITALTEDLIDATSIIVVQPGDTEADLIREAGFSPLVEPFDGARFGTPGFHPWWDWLQDHGGVFEMIVTFGGTYACTLLIRDADGTLPELLDLCRAHA